MLDLRNYVMFDWLHSQDTSAWAAFFSAVATAFAAFATLRGPRSAAKLAEHMRQDSEKTNEIRRLKLFVFTTLMQERAAYYTPEAVKAFNLIDVVFIKSRAVRDAWSEFISAMDENNRVPEHSQRETFRKLLTAMAADLGLASDLRADDFNRVYYPLALSEEIYLKSLQRKASLRELQGNLSPAANTTSAVALTNFPPAPNQTKSE